MNKTLTRADLSEAIYSKVGISKVESSDVVYLEAFFLPSS